MEGVLDTLVGASSGGGGVRVLDSTIHVPHEHKGEACCGCVMLVWIPDEQAYLAMCNECGIALGMAKADWSNPEDRRRLAVIGMEAVA